MCDNVQNHLSIWECECSERMKLCMLEFCVCLSVRVCPCAYLHWRVTWIRSSRFMAPLQIASDFKTVLGLAHNRSEYILVNWKLSGLNKQLKHRPFWLKKKKVGPQTCTREAALSTQMFPRDLCPWHRQQLGTRIQRTGRSYLLKNYLYPSRLNELLLALKYISVHLGTTILLQC